MEDNKISVDFNQKNQMIINRFDHFFNKLGSTQKGEGFQHGTLNSTTGFNRQKDNIENNPNHNNTHTSMHRGHAKDSQSMRELDPTNHTTNKRSIISNHSKNTSVGRNCNLHQEKFESFAPKINTQDRDKM